MAKLAGAALKLVQTILYCITFCCAALIIAFYSYFIAAQADRNIDIPRWEKAVEGISALAVVYSGLAVVFTCCLGGISLFAFMGIVLDIAFAGGLIAVVVLLRDGANSCSTNTVTTPIGSGNPNSKLVTQGNDQQTFSITLHTACLWNQACFSVAIIGAAVFLIAALVQFSIGRNHQREKRYGPSPANNYTSGSGYRFWQRRRGPKTTYAARDAEMAAAGGLVANKSTDIRPSHETGYTASTVGPTTAAYDSHGRPVTPLSGYNTPSTNPHGYDSVRNAAANY